MTKAVMSALIRPLVEPRLPDWIEPLWFASKDEALELAPQAQIGWFDLNEKEPMIEIAHAATNLEWLNSIYAGLDFMPLDLLQERGVVVTNGVGINAITIAEYVVLLMLGHAKGYREVVRAQDRKDWLLDSPGKRELAGERVLLLGLGAIGQLIRTRLEAFDMTVVPVRRSGGEGALKPGEWRERLGEFDWVVLAVPSTPETKHMIGAAELAAMRPNAVLVNIARGDVVDQDALVGALQGKSIEAALLELERIAFLRGRAIGIGHPAPNTIAALQQWLPDVGGRGFKIVRASGLAEVPVPASRVRRCPARALSAR